jgi:NAD(P)-dependent dehydrogenase (short-subunit alcohol dehydrogenase family)
VTNALESPFGLTGTIAVVTGGASGIGLGIVEVLAEAGAFVIIADIDAARAETRALALGQAGHRVGCIAVNLADEASIVSGCAEMVAQYGVPWVLVNNAGVQDRQLLLDSTAAEWDRTMGVNARGPYLMTREIARAMVQQGQGGRIINIASAALIGSLTKGHAAYASSKAALLGLTRASALDLVEHGITVNTVLPGGVATPGARAATGPVPTGPGTRRPPLGLSEPRDIGAAVLFFAAPASHRVTNQTLAVDAGWSLT